MSKVLLIVGLSIFFIIIDLYIYQAIKVTISGLSSPWRKGIVVGFWTLTALSVVAVLLINTMASDFFPGNLKRMIVVGIVMLYFSKVFGVIALLLDDIFRAGQWILNKIIPPSDVNSPIKDGMTRSEFMSKASLIAVAVPLTTFGIGIATGAHNYRVRRKTIHLSNLPSAFDGIRIGQLSDIHSGSFFSRQGVKKGIDLNTKDLWIVGHLHTPQIYPNIWFPGSPYQLSFGEKNNKGWCLFKIKKQNDILKHSIQFIPNKPSFELITKEINSTEDLKTIINKNSVKYKLITLLKGEGNSFSHKCLSKNKKKITNEKKFKE